MTHAVKGLFLEKESWSFDATQIQERRIFGRLFLKLYFSKTASEDYNPKIFGQFDQKILASTLCSETLTG